MASLKANKLANRNRDLANIRSASPRVLSTEEDIHVYGYGHPQPDAPRHVASCGPLVQASDEYAGLSADEWKNTSIPKDVDGRFSSCARYEPPMPTPEDNKTEVSCDRRYYDSEVGATIVRNFNFVCNRKWVLRRSGTTLMHWSAMQLVAISPTLLLLLTYSPTDEFPRWLITSWKFKDTERVILWAARKNGLSDLNKVR
ncbi:hypothetical protein IscW_ISCW002650 [Ixodes scapularis]|uniref:Uncharacterized protein n=1 Tax=Ixodes scapularis TaxID=6945 RepID=B7P859_IXOSC|nr:hypothetical protein IscW_ISCW002650 [Ixodes scapularis]|eukprot:XP_002401432.1 hypothetical protein IscW_ISCW002650 [Ixodes scapularis]